MPLDFTGKLETKYCAECDATFLQRNKNQKYCSSRCRKDRYQRADREKYPTNAATSPATARRQYEFYQRALDLAEQLYSLPPNQRLRFINSLVEAARTDDRVLANIFTNPKFLYPDLEEKWIFYRRCPRSYVTISQAANAYCHRFWGAPVTEVVRGSVPEPATGEIFLKKGVLTIRSSRASQADTLAILTSTLEGDTYDGENNNNLKPPFL